ncbi:hypothetical protein [Krasilnikovia sp. MM14-A1259]|uniref:hypothetical protein n=1 Tax=Krasilnikovia sp. MM14-A1259 TaxID=3373539 RepID=UPI003814FC07
MSEHLEQQLRTVFGQDAADAPTLSPATAGEVARRVQRRRRLGILTAAAAVVLGSGVSLALASMSAGPDAPRSGPVAARHGALADTGAADCAAYGSARDITARGFAFDGTVSSIASPATVAPGGYTAVTFAVHEWFHGGSGDRVTVTMMAPLRPGQHASEAGPSYGTGSRLLVSGDTSPGLVARTCGYTRYYDQATGDAWRAASNGG